MPLAQTGGVCQIQRAATMSAGARMPVTRIASKAGGTATTGRPAQCAPTAAASTTATISTPASVELSTAISARSLLPSRTTRFQPLRRHSVSSSLHCVRAVRKKAREIARYSAVSRPFSAKPVGVK
ncbi:hypothetical protein [Caenispirillum bisanense]|uniref:hypothetical protein n=1 Tax=Caenispirillum bisanense TaxID=414052 RepID=UPI0031D190A2